MRVERVEGVVERRRNQGPCALKPWLPERLSSASMASHPTDFVPTGDGFPSCSRQVWELDVRASA